MTDKALAPLTQEQLLALAAPLPDEALTSDRSRGFELTSTKAAYIIERLNSVLGPVGYGWRYAHTPTTTEGKEVLLEVVLQYRIGENGCPPMRWDRAAQDWCFDGGPPVWSEPITAYGGNQITGGGTPVLDAMKSAVTAGITKAASRIGVASDVHKGLRRVGQPTPQASQPPNGDGHQPKEVAWETYWTTFSEEKVDREKWARAGQAKVTFGKHSGKSLAEIDHEDRSYLRWLSEVFNAQGDARKITLKNAAIYFRACRKWVEAQSQQAAEEALNL